MLDSNTFRDYEMHTILKDRLGIIKPWTSIEGIHLICLCLRTLHISILALFCNIMIFSMSSYGYYYLDYHYRYWRDGVGHMKIVYTTHHMYDWYLNRCTRTCAYFNNSLYQKLKYETNKKSTMERAPNMSISTNHANYCILI